MVLMFNGCIGTITVASAAARRGSADRASYFSTGGTSRTTRDDL